MQRLLKKNSEPHTGARPSVRLCVGPELARCVHNNTRYVERYSIAVGDTNGNPPQPNEPTWTVGNNMPVLFSRNQLVNAGNPTTITPRTVNRANQKNRRN